MYTRIYCSLAAIVTLVACKIDGHFVNNNDGGVTDDSPNPSDGGPPMGWAVAFGGTGQDTFNDIALGSNGEVVAVGSFEGS